MKFDYSAFLLSEIKKINDEYIKNNLNCKQCGCELTSKEIDRDYGLCESCDGECHCRDCEESK